MNKQEGIKIFYGGLAYIIDKKEKTAGVTKTELENGEIIIPCTIIYNSKTYIVTSILERAFEGSSKITSVKFASGSEVQVIKKNAFFHSSIKEVSFPSSLTKIEKCAFLSCEFLHSIVFPPDSELNTIENNAFCMSNIESITFPPKLVKLEEGWCNGMAHLRKIEVSNNNKLFKVYHNQFIIGKSSPEKENFDVLVCSVRNINNVQIPSFIEIISPYAFSECINLRIIKFQTNSKLQSNSNLKIIEKSAFSCSSICSLLIPSTVIELKDGWCDNTAKLTKIKVMSENQRYKCFENKFIIGKSSIDKEYFDTLVFSVRDIKKAKLPSFIEVIGKYAFDGCQLQSIKIPNDSKLQVIDDFAFKSSSIEYLKIPSKIKTIGDYAFVSCMKLQRIEISNDSEIQAIGKNAFSNTIIEKFRFPPNLTEISKGTFCNCIKLKKIEFPVNSKVQIIREMAFSTISINCISVPPEVNKIEQKAFFFCMKIQIIEINEATKLKEINASMFHYIDAFIMIPAKLNHIININEFDELNS